MAVEGRASIGASSVVTDERRRCTRSGRGTENIAEHKRKNPSVFVVVHLNRCINPQNERHNLFLPVLPLDLQIHGLARLKALVNTQQRKSLRTVEMQRLSIHSLVKLQRRHAHADKVAAMNPFKACGYDRLDSEQPR